MSMEPDQMKNQHDISIALIQKDISYIRESMAKMEGTLGGHEKLYAKKEELMEVVKNIEQWQKEVRIAIDNKVSVTDFEPIKTTLSRINWMLIAAIVSALLALVLKTNI